ncbi:MAG TPA: hypothetical protein VF780_08225, partial [Nitrosospira sp.]
MGYRARRDDAKWLFHFKELQRSLVPQKTCNPPRSGVTKKVNTKLRKKSLWIIAIKLKMSGQLP